MKLESQNIMNTRPSWWRTECCPDQTLGDLRFKAWGWRDFFRLWPFFSFILRFSSKVCSVLVSSLGQGNIINSQSDYLVTSNVGFGTVSQNPFTYRGRHKGTMIQALQLLWSLTGISQSKATLTMKKSAPQPYPFLSIAWLRASVSQLVLKWKFKISQ